VRSHVLASLERKGMKLGVPYAEELQIKDNEANRAQAAARELERHRRVLAHCELFGGLSGAELDELAGKLVHAPFVSGDTITRQGDVAHWLYIIDSGNAEVVIETPAGRRPLATLLGGSVFGEMGMMTGEPRRATVIARSDVDLLPPRQGRLRVDPARAPRRGQRHLAGARQPRDRAGERHGIARQWRGHRPGGEQILRRIRDFFGLDAP
jgi:hypothetical protein